VAPTQAQLGANFAVWRDEAARRAGGSDQGVECSDLDRAVANGLPVEKIALFVFATRMQALEGHPNEVANWIWARMIAAKLRSRLDLAAFKR
jgi:hypothetical protein